ncbi:PREDICTED: zinc phosphodiesterase ELAC protein 1-like [Branchiostoma belcheri]|uniref:Zinc phosphodiesterase ELAC protein 1-like n=1 Tax=Branchiostoma belcheri TaxID=7741 RepID=A0A6P4Y9P1_BRABE|nr:PREDICTED: zinc phosphodiesterase ELAC protein 1-like [Branchiostoma belcheri]
MDLTFLGTASCYPMPNRGVSCVVFKSDRECWMFDCGEGSQIQVMKSSIKAAKINKIFITHLHGDHLFGLQGFLCTLSLNLAEQTSQKTSQQTCQQTCQETSQNPSKTSEKASQTPSVEIYGPLGLRRYLRTCLELSRSPISFSYVVHELEPVEDQLPQDWEEWHPEHTSSGPVHPGEGEGRNIRRDETGAWHLFEDSRFVVKAGAIYHRIPCFGYIIQKKTLPGKLDAAKLKELGVPPGPLYSRIKQGETVTLENGQLFTFKIDPKDVVGPSRPGRKVVILGDTHDPSPLTSLAQGADVVVHEATLENSLRSKAIEVGHSTPEMAATFGKTIGAKTLILTHFSQRYRPLGAILEKGEESVSKLQEEAAAVFGADGVITAQDLQTVHIPQPTS